MKNEDIPVEVVEEIKEAFDFYDKSGSGYIKLRDIDNVLKRLGENLDHFELSQLTEAMNVDKKKDVSFEDFVRELAPRLQKDIMKKSLIKAFKVFDREKTGYISGSELMIILTNLLDNLKFAPLQVAILVKTADTDGDGQIKYEDFTNTMLNVIFSKTE